MQVALTTKLLFSATASLWCSTPLSSTTAIANTGASQHYFMPTALVTHRNTNAPPTTVFMATGANHKSTASGLLALSTLPYNQVHLGHIIPEFTDNLLSLGHL